MAATPDHVRYFDHAATSWPKPSGVIEAMAHAMTHAGGNPGRGAHSLALAASRTILESRDVCARYLGVHDSRDLAFMPSCTVGMNLALKGLLKPGDRVIVSSMEHNAVARPLNVLAAQGVRIDTVLADITGLVDLGEVERMLAHSPARAVICQHASNLSGSIQPVADLVDIAHAAGALMIVDGAQAAGHLKIDLGTLGADVYTAAGHKGLLGPQGVGLLYLAPGVEPVELVQGGGGGPSDEPFQPQLRPDRYEAGTGNLPGVAGLGAAVSFLAAHENEIFVAEQALTQRLLEGLEAIDGLRVLGPMTGEPRVPVVSVVHERVDADRIAFELDRGYGIAVRAGLHCAPWAHKTLGTLETGAVRFSLGLGLTGDDVDAAVVAMRAICG